MTSSRHNGGSVFHDAASAEIARESPPDGLEGSNKSVSFSFVLKFQRTSEYKSVDGGFLPTWLVSVFQGGGALSPPRSPFLLNQMFQTDRSLFLSSSSLLFPPLVSLPLLLLPFFCFSLHILFLLSPSFLGHCGCSHGNHRIHVCLIHMRSINNPAGWR